MQNVTFGNYMYNWYMIYKYPKHQITTRNVCLTYINIHVRPSNIAENLFKIFQPEIYKNFYLIYYSMEINLFYVRRKKVYLIGLLIKYVHL